MNIEPEDKHYGIILAASVGCIDPLEFRDKITELDRGGIDAYHFDLSDGHFAPTIVLSIPTIGAFRRCTDNRIDVHIYCTHPSTFLEELKENGTDTCIICIESDENIREVIHKIRDAGMRVGIGILPTSDIPKDMPDLLTLTDMVIANTVGPAYPGQPFNPRGLKNLSAIHRMITDSGRDIELAVDGNVRLDRIRDFLSRGARHFVCGTSSIFIPDTDLGENILDLRREIASVMEDHSSL